MQIAAAAGMPPTDFSQPGGRSSYLRIQAPSCWNKTLWKIEQFQEEVTATHSKMAYILWLSHSPKSLNLLRHKRKLNWSPSAMGNALIIKVSHTPGRHLTWWCTYLLYAGSIYIWRQTIPFLYQVKEKKILKICFFNQSYNILKSFS